MKKKIYFTGFAILFLVLVDWIFFQLRLYGNSFKYTDVLFIFIYCITLLIVILNFGYKECFDFKTKPFIFLSYFIFFLFISIFVSQRFLVVNKLYFFTKSYRQDEKGKLWQNDDKLSYKGRPDFSGTQNYFIGDSIKGFVPALFDSAGFRTVESKYKIKSDTLNLFLGCSFTFGSYINAEETFAYKLSKKLNNDFINAAGSGYGVGQMMILLDTLLSKHRLKYVFIQLSPWLIDRAIQINAPFYYFYRPIPYFSEKNDTFKLNDPAYKNTSITFKYNWNESAPDYFEKIKFTFTDGIKIEIYDYIIQKFAKFKIFVGIAPSPAKNRNDLEKYVYDIMIEKCKHYSATPVILKLSYDNAKADEISEYLKPKCVFIDLDKALYNVVNETGSSYHELYSIFHEHNGQKIIFDTHPNAFANDIIANKIYDTLLNN